ncbi:hypothetical protein R3W88_014185 [Solanum pinnatisectum]|uniref:Uncharacterized protein n=1 Tax=Solanum pinnatisectum TaxID=50273 RepID=A0AAV9KS07_9SOLN|nr:hypothetical protein R3W88_014185 [Solanum pinnatisectum]
MEKIGDNMQVEEMEEIKDVQARKATMVGIIVVAWAIPTLHVTHRTWHHFWLDRIIFFLPSIFFQVIHILITWKFYKEMMKLIQEEEEEQDRKQHKEIDHKKPSYAFVCAYLFLMIFMSWMTVS